MVMIKLIEMTFLKSRSTIKKITERFLLFLIFVFQRNKKIIEKKDIHRIIIPLISGMGDAVIFTCCLQELQNLFPDTKINIITTDRTQDVLDDTFPDIKFTKLNSYYKLFKLRYKYDLMISPSRNIRHYLIALIIRPKYLIGYNYTLFHKEKKSHIERANEILHQLGGQNQNIPIIKISQQKIEMSLRFIKKNIKYVSSKQLISFIIGGQWKSKIYPAEKYRQLAEILIKKYDSDIVLLGTDPDTGDKIAMGKKKIHNLAGKTFIQEVMGIIHLSQLIIGPDGGLLNIAMAMNKPIVGLFGPVDPHTIVSDKHLNNILYQKKCEFQPCYNEEYQPRCPFDQIRCMNHPVEDILGKIEAILSKKNSVNI